MKPKYLFLVLLITISLLGLPSVSAELITPVSQDYMKFTSISQEKEMRLIDVYCNPAKFGATSTTCRLVPIKAIAGTTTLTEIYDALIGVGVVNTIERVNIGTAWGAIPLTSIKGMTFSKATIDGYEINAGVQTITINFDSPINDKSDIEFKFGFNSEVVVGVTTATALNYSNNIHIARDNDANMLYAVWDDANIFFSESSDEGVTWSPPIFINANDPSVFPSIPSIDINSTGGIHVAYMDIDGTMNPYTNCVDTCTVFANWTIPVDISEQTGGSSSDGSTISISPDDNILFAYTNTSEDLTAVNTCYTGDGCSDISNWSGVTTGLAGSVSCENCQFNIQFTSDNNRYYFVAFDDEFNDNTAINISFCPNTSNCGEAASWSAAYIEPGVSGSGVNARNPSAVINSDGNIIIVYTNSIEDVDTDSNVYFTTCNIQDDPSGCISETSFTPAIILDLGDYNATNPTLINDVDGNLWVTWQDDNSFGLNVWNIYRQKCVFGSDCTDPLAWIDGNYITNDNIVNSNPGVRQTTATSGDPIIDLIWAKGSVTNDVNILYAPYETFVEGAGLCSGALGDGSLGDPCQINTCQLLQDMNTTLDANYVLTSNVNCGVAPFNTGLGFNPIGLPGAGFLGDLDGADFNVTSLFIDRNTSDNIGLFGELSFSSFVHDLGITGALVSGDDNVGVLTGASLGDLNRVIVTGNSFGDAFVGGLTGVHYLGDINFTQSFADVNGASNVGGLIGNQVSTADLVFRSAAYGDVTSTHGSNIGGLIGGLRGILVSESVATGNVRGGSDLGGFAGLFRGTGTIINSYATGDVNGIDSGSQVGGFIGDSADGSNLGTVTNAYATGIAFRGGAGTSVGGFSGFTRLINFNNIFSTGPVNSVTFAGGLLGLVQINTSTNNSYWDANRSTRSNMCGSGSGCNDLNNSTDSRYFFNQSNDPLVQWNFSTIWDSSWDNAGYPPLLWENLAAPVPEFRIDFNVFNADSSTHLTAITVDVNNDTFDRVNQNSPFFIYFPVSIYDVTMSVSGFDNNNFILNVSVAATEVIRLTTTPPPAPPEPSSLSSNAFGLLSLIQVILAAFLLITLVLTGIAARSGEFSGLIPLIIISVVVLIAIVVIGAILVAV